MALPLEYCNRCGSLRSACDCELELLRALEVAARPVGYWIDRKMPVPLVSLSAALAALDRFRAEAA